MDLLDASDYRHYLSDLIDQNKSRGFHKTLANAAGCHPSYLSKVLAESCHLTPDHAANLSEFLNFGAIEGAYFLELVNYGRAGSPTLRKVLRSRLDGLRAQARDVAIRVGAPAAKDEELIYYSNWMLAAVHLLVSVPGFQTTDALATKLETTPSAVDQLCLTLASIGLIAREGLMWVQTRPAIHAVRGSPAAFLHLNNWRQHASQRSLRDGPQSIHFTGLYSLSKKDAQFLHGELIKFIGNTSDRVRASPEEEAVCMNIDFFEL